HLCILIDTSITPSDMAVLELITQIWSTNGDVGAEVNKTLADGRVEAQEVVKVRAAIYRAQKAMFEMVARLDGMSEKAPSTLDR
ncbi:MAG: phage regulatory CII family protein, partial [Pseudomonadota bacterium]